MTRSFARATDKPEPSWRIGFMGNCIPGRHKPGTRWSRPKIALPTRTALFPSIWPTGWKPSPQEWVDPQDWRAEGRTVIRGPIDSCADGGIFVVRRAAKRLMTGTVFGTCPRGGFHADWHGFWDGGIARLGHMVSAPFNPFNALQSPYRGGKTVAKKLLDRSPRRALHAYDPAEIGKDEDIERNAPFADRRACLEQACAALPERRTDPGLVAQLSFATWDRWRFNGALHAMPKPKGGHAEALRIAPIWRGARKGRIWLEMESWTR